MHGIFYDPINDEIVLPVALAGAVLVFRGGATGDEKPLRVIQGPRSRIVKPDTLYVDLEHDELIVDSGEDGVLIFPRTADGDVAPLREIKGPKSRISSIFGLTVDPVRNLIFVANRIERPNSRDSDDGILVFNRTDNGDVAPRAAIGGPKTGIVKIRQMVADPERGQIFVSVKNNREFYEHEHTHPTPWDPDHTGFIGVWSVTDNGDVPPRGVIKGPASGLVWPAGVAINPLTKEVYAIDSVSNAMFTFFMPELFMKPSAPSNARQ
jgi:hypothetical protein